MNSASVFLFAHQDDEFAVYQKIIDEISIGRRVYCIYFTEGVLVGESSRRRNQESSHVLRKLGVVKENVFFVGAELSIADATLPRHLDEAIAWLENWLKSMCDVESIYIPAWEGGHHDHDALHAIGVVVSISLNRLDVTKQFSLYNAYRCPGPFFKVLSPLDANGNSECSVISYSNRVRFMLYCLNYPSQFFTWIGLFPFVFLHYIFSGRQTLQEICVRRIYERPHPGALYYEKRNFFNWDMMLGRLSDCRRLQEVVGAFLEKK